MRGLSNLRRAIGTLLTVALSVGAADALALNAESGFCGAAIADKRIKRELLCETVVVCKDCPLDTLLTVDLAERHGIRFEIDTAALKQAGVAPDVPVSHDLRRITLKRALDIVVGGQGLIWEVRNDRIVITAKK